MRRGGFPRPAHETALSLFERVCCASVPVGPFVRSHRAFPHPSEGRRAAVGVIQAAHEIGRQGRRRAYVAGAVRVSQAPLSLMSSIGGRAREATRSGHRAGRSAPHVSTPIAKARRIAGAGLMRALLRSVQAASPTGYWLDSPPEAAGRCGQVHSVRLTSLLYAGQLFHYARHLFSAARHPIKEPEHTGAVALNVLEAAERAGCVALRVPIIQHAGCI
jgi:hypothetical protein